MMAANNVINVDPNLVKELCVIANVEEIVATTLLEACGNNLEMAVNMHIEGPVTDHNEPGGSHSCSTEEVDSVRSPIPQKQEILVDSRDELSFSFRGRSKMPRSVFDKFRDFEAETKRQEEEFLSSEGSMKIQTARKRKMKTLEDLFRPPLDIMFRGNFQAARDKGILEKKWLLVNIQNSSEFPCQVLNRDVWSNSAVKVIIKEHFIFWQIYHDSDEGLRYNNFYPVSEWPNISIIDPRTGELLVTWSKMDPVTFCDLVTDFISRYPSLDESSSPKKNLSEKKTLEERNSIIEADESAQIEAAIKASLSGTSSCNEKMSSNGNISDSGDEHSVVLETFDSENDSVDYSLNSNNIGRETDDEMKNLEADSNELSEYKVIKRVKKDQSYLEGAEEQLSCGTSINNHIIEKSEQSKQGDHQHSENMGQLRIDDAAECKWKNYLGKPEDKESKLMLRFPNGTKESITMPSSSKLMALVLYVATKGYSNEQYEMVTTFPKRQLSQLDFHSTLLSVGLYPQEAVFIQKR